MWDILWFCRTSGTVSPSLFEPYNLNHVSVFLLTLRLSCLPSGQPVLASPSPTYLVGLSTYVIKLPCLNLITLITYQFSFLLFACLACLRVSLCSLPLAPRTLLAYQHTWLSLFWTSFRSFYPPTNRFRFFSTKYFYSSPPWVLSPTFHFSLPFSPSWIASASLLLCLFAFVLFVASVVSAAGWVGLTRMGT